MRILESHGVDFTTFQLDGKARRWWQSYVLGKLAGSSPITWSQFTQLFLDRYIPPSEREELRYQFEQLEQGQMLVTDYEARFSELSRHALMILPTNAERVQRFVAGLHSGIRDNMAREVEMGTPYQLVVEIAWRIEGYRLRGREKMQQDKRDRFSREFRGAPIWGRGQFERGHPGRPPYSAPPPARGAPARPYFSAIPESSYRPPAIQGSSGGYLGPQGSSDSYFSAMSKSSYRPPTIQASSSGSTGIISVGVRDASVLFDPGSTYSYVSSLFARFLVISPEPLGTHVHVSTPVQHMVEKGCLAYLVYVRDTTVESPIIDSVPVVREFANVFPSNLPGMPPDRDIDFCIDLAPGTQPISIPPYHMTPKEQLEELLSKGFVRPSVSPWGAPVLFVKKKDGTLRMFIDYR
ncbi:uncharacterized protein [Nicotiana sylvestris]|uniref:uncharacterized protein n=1 Tax=Nicotiana sylvestris TaxID=4096 RepID=UPI00388C7B8D